MALKLKRRKERKWKSGNCTLPETIRSQAVAEFSRLETEFKSAKGKDNSFEKFQALVEHFRAHTVDYDFMDFNYGVLTATIFMHDGEIVLDRSVEVWHDRCTEYLGTYTLK